MKLIAAFCLLFLCACQSPTSGPAVHKVDTPKPAALAKAAPDTTTLGGVWWLQPVLASDTAAGKTPVLQLDPAKSRFSGNTGCNTMHGQCWFSNTDSSLSFSDKIAMTKMACPGYNEAAFIKSLKNASHYRLHDGTLTLLSDNNTELSRWARKPANRPKALKA